MGVVSRRQALAGCVAAALGLLWYAGFAGVVLSPMFVEVWKRAHSRREAFANALAYYAAATLPMALAQSAYADVLPLEVVMVSFASASLLAGVWALGWTGVASWWRRAVGLVLVLLVTAVPGIGFLGVASPLTAAGAWFPGTGFLGLGLLVLLASASWRRRNAASVAAVGGALIATVAHATSSASSSGRFAGLATDVATTDQATDFLAQFRAFQAAQEALRAQETAAEVLVLGEGLGGVWTDAMAEAWSETARPLVADRKAVVVGSSRPEYGRGYQNGAVILDAGGARFVPQRAPLPYVMWRPWAEVGSYDVRPWDSGVVDVGEGRAGLLICWEQVLVFPVLWSVLSGAESLVGLSNLHHVGNAAALERWQRAALASWGALFSLPIAYAVNR